MRTQFLEVSAWNVLQRLLVEANALVVEVMLTTGLRVSDVLSLRTAQLKSRFTVTESKTGKRKRIYIRKDLLERLKAQAGEVYVFEGARSKDKHRTRQAVWRDIKRASRAMRLERCVACHSARKSFAVEKYRQSGGDMDKVRHLLNHDDLATTVIYLLSEFEKKPL